MEELAFFLFFVLIGVILNLIGTIVKEMFKKKREPKYEGPFEKATMILWVREDLKMGKGKIGAQISHAVLKTYKRSRNTKFKWDKHMLIFQVASEEELLKRFKNHVDHPNGLVRDAGRT